MSIDPVGRWRRIAPTNLRAAAWTVLSLWRAKRTLRARGVAGRIPFPPPLPDGAARGMLAVLRRTAPTCLERATVLQTWLAAHRQPVEIVVGVATEGGQVTAHAWIEPGTAAAAVARYRVIHRIPAPELDGPGRTLPSRTSG